MSSCGPHTDPAVTLPGAKSPWKREAATGLVSTTSLEMPKSPSTSLPSRR